MAEQSPPNNSARSSHYSYLEALTQRYFRSRLMLEDEELSWSGPGDASVSEGASELEDESGQENSMPEEASKNEELPPRTPSSGAQEQSDNLQMPLPIYNNSFPENFLRMLEISSGQTDTAHTQYTIKTFLWLFFQTADPLLLDRFWRYMKRSDQSVLNAAFAALPQDDSVLVARSHERQPTFLYPEAVMDCVTKIRELHLTKWIDVVMDFLENDAMVNDAGAFYTVLTRDMFYQFLFVAEPAILQRLVRWSQTIASGNRSGPQDSTWFHPLEKLVEWLPSKSEVLENAVHPAEAVATVVCLLDSLLLRFQYTCSSLQRELWRKGRKQQDESAASALQQKHIEIIVRMNLISEQILDFAQEIRINPTNSNNEDTTKEEAHSRF